MMQEESLHCRKLLKVTQKGGLREQQQKATSFRVENARRLDPGMSMEPLV